MTYGELRTTAAGWVTSHVIGDICNNARFCYGKGFKDVVVSEYDLSEIRSKATHFGEPVPPALNSI